MTGILLTVFLGVCANVFVCTPKPAIPQVGVASYYDYSLAGFQGYSLTHYTAASRYYKKGTLLAVCTETDSQCVTVRVNDFGPDAKIFPERIIDLSSKAFAGISSLRRGVVRVVVKPI